jgi:ubiquinone/menaquinone biosynthesis C-methylase UbiE
MILDIGCGGGETIRKLSKRAPNGKIFGVDHSADSVATARKINAKLIDAGQVEIQNGSVSQLPFNNDQFDVVTAVETHFFWPDLPNDVGEVRRVLKPAGTSIVIAEVYKGSTTLTGQLAQKYIDHSGMRIMSIDEHREMLEQAGFHDVRITTSAGKGWICAIGSK